MKIIIVGGGKVGEVLCRDLDTEGNDVILIEEQEDVLTSIVNVADITGLIGNGASYDILMEAGVAACDVFIAVTERDEINIVSSIIAKKMGAAYTIARVRNPEYALHADFMSQSLGINAMVNPEREAARAMRDLVRYPMALSLERFAHGRVSIISLRLSADSKYVGKTLHDVQQILNGRLLVAIVERGDEAIVPDGSFCLQANDVLYVTGESPVMSQFYRECGNLVRRMRSLLIIGGGRVTYYLLQYLVQGNLQIKVIEHNREVAERLARVFPSVAVICADGSDQDVLDEEGIARFDGIVASTGIDEENLLISMYAKSCGVGRIITKVDRTMLLRILDPDSYGAIITPKRLIADMIVRDVRSLKNAIGSSVETLYRLADGRAEAMEFLIHENSALIGMSLTDLSIRPGILILAILRDNDIIYPAGKDVVHAGDRLIVISSHRLIKTADELLEEW